ncbi:MAG: CDP-glycerol glycerophosphotransferase family protein [Pseudohongiellaceae bacterium]
MRKLVSKIGIVLPAAFIALYSNTSFAYLDPASGNAVASFFIALFGSAVFFFKSLFYKIVSRSPATSKASKLSGLDFKTPIIFSEGKTYWTTFRPIVEELLKREIEFRYITLDVRDPALLIDSPYMDSKLVSKNRLGFAKIAQMQGPVMISTTPNIGSEGYPLNRPVNVANLVHVFHALVDLSCYRKGSLDHYDSVLLAGEHEVDAVRKVERARQLPNPKQLVVAGLPCLDDLSRQKEELVLDKSSNTSQLKTVLIAPSWGNKGCFTEYGTGFIKVLSDAGFAVIIRLHPHSFVFEPDCVEKWRTETGSLANVVWDNETFGTQAMTTADILISDASSIRFDFAFLYEKPVISLEIPAQSRDIFESDYMEHTWADTMVDKIGSGANRQELSTIDKLVASTLEQFSAQSLAGLREEYVANFGSSATVIADYLVEQAEFHSTSKLERAQQAKFEALESRIEELNLQLQLLNEKLLERDS